MQSSLEFFCEECGAANPEDATLCIACKEPLAHPPSALSTSIPIKPVVVAPPAVLQVVAGSPTTPEPDEVVTDVLVPGTLLHNRYRIASSIGEGGYSIVYKAADMAHHRRAVTIKQINLRNLTSRQIIDATTTFNREKDLLPALKHPGIPQFYDHFTDPEHWYLVMQFIPGHTLEDYLQKTMQKGYCSLRDTLKIGIALSSILEYLHKQHPAIIFRDVKPANIMLTPGKKLYLIDFGIARAFNPAKAKDTTPLGSPGYAAPEQYGRTQSDTRTDIYGLGATLQTLLTGRDPLELQTQPSRAPRPIPLYMQKILDAMLNPVASQRPYSMGQVKQELQKALVRARRLTMYCSGLFIGIVYLLCRIIINQVVMSLILAHNSDYSFFPLFLLIELILTLIMGFVILVFLFIPSKRYFSFGALTIILPLMIFTLLTGH